MIYPQNDAAGGRVMGVLIFGPEAVRAKAGVTNNYMSGDFARFRAEVFGQSNHFGLTVNRPSCVRTQLKCLNFLPLQTFAQMIEKNCRLFAEIEV